MLTLLPMAISLQRSKLVAAFATWRQVWQQT
jgi:hypothetical protein